MTGPFEEPEGATPLSADDRQGLKLPHIETRNELNEVEQANIDEAQQWLYRHRDLNVLDDLFLRDLHGRMFNQVWTWAGIYRDRETNIGVAPNVIGARVRDLVRDVHAWIEFDHYAPVEVAARFHHQLVFIHPFPNGNGRHARIAADALIAFHYGLPRLDWTRGVDVDAVTPRRQAYLAALRAADAGDIRPLLEFLTDS